MTTETRENCGVVGAVRVEGDVVQNIWLAMLALQHRGQESNGIYTHDGTRFHNHKGLGLVPGAEDFLSLKGCMGIGHVRYSTVGRPAYKDDSRSVSCFVQPFFVDYPKKGIALGHNGNIVNNYELSNELLTMGVSMTSDSDSEMMLKLLAQELIRSEDLERSVRALMNRLEGGYSIVAVTGEKELFAFRDPLGFRPLCYGKNDDLCMIASESVALNVNGINDFTSVRPGELVTLNETGEFKTKQLIVPKRRAHCMFEYVYFSRPDSVIDGIDVYTTRIKLGRNLAKTRPAKADVIVPVPDTSRPAGEGLSRETGIPVEEGLIKNRYIGRTFIMPEQRYRDASMNVKLNPIKSVIADRHVALVDDSIVRGTTLKKIINLVRKAGAKSIDVWVTCPPIVSPCFYGIDISTHGELVAHNRTIKEIEKEVGADNVQYQSIEGLIDAIGLPREDLCNACLTGNYPTPLAQKISDSMKANPQKERVRYWEIGKNAENHS